MIRLHAGRLGHHNEDSLHVPYAIASLQQVPTLELYWRCAFLKFVKVGLKVVSAGACAVGGSWPAPLSLSH
jgi:hypothetical protein